MATFAVKIGTYAIGTSAAVSAMKLMTSRRVTEHPIIRSDMTIVPEGKMNPLRIDLEGTIAGSDYTSLRSALMGLRGAIEGTTKEFYIDDERYARVVSRNFDYAFVTKDFCNYNVSLMGELPYFLAVAAGSVVDETGLISGTAFNVSNLGDIKIPCKIVIKGATAATISNNIQFENATLGTLCKFTGVLQITSTLVIDLGYDYNNVPTYLVTLDGVNAMGSFEGDFMELAVGSNSLEYTGAAGGTVSVYYRRGFYS